MDRLLVLESKELVLHFELGQRCSGQLHIRSVMHTMSVAFKVQTTAPFKYAVRPYCGIIQPLGTAVLELMMQATTEYPENFPLTNDKFVVKSVVVPGSFKEAIPPAEWFNSKNKVVFADLRLRAVVVGGGILRQLLARPKSCLEDIRSVLERGVDVDSVDMLGKSPMHLAVASGRPELVQVLLEYRPKLETKSREGRTPLQDAAEAGEALMVEILLCRGSDPNAADAAGTTALHLALVGGHLDVVRLLLDKGANVDAVLSDGRTAVHVAVEEGLKKSLEVLLQHGAIADAVIPDTGKTALHLAAARNDKSVVKLLVKYGANSWIRDKQGQSAADLAAVSGHVKLLELLELGDKLRDAARRGDHASVHHWLEMGARVNGQDGRGWGALHRAAFKGHLRVVGLLLDAEADMELRNTEGHTPLHCAAEAGQTEVVKLLLTRGANRNAKTKNGTSVLGIAMHMHLPPVLNLLERKHSVAAPRKPKGVLRLPCTDANHVRHKKKVAFNLLEGQIEHASRCGVSLQGTILDRDQDPEFWKQMPDCSRTPSFNIKITFCYMDHWQKLASSGC